MLECLIVGDSIAVGTHQFAPKCELQGRGGINTWQFNRMYPGKFAAGVVIISLGSNDHQHVKTKQELEAMRKRVQAQQVFWILPAGNLKASNVPIQKVQDWVREVAQEYNDEVLPIRGLQKDGIHPSWSGYRDIVDRTR